MRFNSKQLIVACENSKTKTASLFAVIVIVTASTAGLWWAGSSAAENDFEISDEELQVAIQDKFAELSAEYDSQMMAEYGITYAEYNAAMDYLSDKAIYITTENGELVAHIVESIDKGKTMTDSELRNDKLRIYIDTVSMSGLTSAGITIFTATLGTLIGSVAFPGEEH